MCALRDVGHISWINILLTMVALRPVRGVYAQKRAVKYSAVSSTDWFSGQPALANEAENVHATLIPVAAHIAVRFPHKPSGPGVFRPRAEVRLGFLLS